LLALPRASTPEARALEVGTHGLFLKALKDVGGYSRVDGVVLEHEIPYKVLRRSYSFDADMIEYELYNCNLERECVPVAGEVYDCVLAAEVLEHMSVDPMAFLMEVNRITKPGGRLLLTTPNVASTESIFRALWRQIPSVYYQYRKGRHTDRHNLEYGPDLLTKLVENAGYKIERIWTEDSWSSQRSEIVQLIDEAGFPPELRGDNLFVVGLKVGPTKSRFPDFLYD
jgi:SAM-dependent methyltransferase